MPRGLDHIVHVVRDLDAAADLYRRLGFTVGARNQHPRSWGAQNHIVQLPGTYIELLAVTATTEIAPHLPRHFSFGAFNRDWVAREQGLSMLVLEGQGAPDADDFRATGIGDYDLYEFERHGKGPDGTLVSSPSRWLLHRIHARRASGSLPAFSATRRISGVPPFSPTLIRRRPLLASYSSRKRRLITQNFLRHSLARTVVEHRMA